MRITVRVTPNAKTDEIVGYENGAWKVRLHAPPIQGRANEALIEFLAEVLKCSTRDIQIKKGFGSRIKIVEIPFSLS